ncbi:unnamed protein product [Pieris macdunnoughi]|uniref:Uncharacterized protein n=1 Tax=Pieris macdunnoughi TaxID=345717 RepID=A0A821M4J0_9NEOP|nr:unnamed protein product [Pieris macdunnoughi]
MTTGQYGRQVPATLYGQQQVQARVTAGRLAVARPHEPRQVDVTRGCFAPVYGLRQLVSRTKGYLNHRHLTKCFLKIVCVQRRINGYPVLGTECYCCIFYNF